MGIYCLVNSNLETVYALAEEEEQAIELVKGSAMFPDEDLIWQILYVVPTQELMSKEDYYHELNKKIVQRLKNRLKRKSIDKVLDKKYVQRIVNKLLEKDKKEGEDNANSITQSYL